MDVSRLGGVVRYFDQVPDPRRFNTTYTLTQMLTMTLLAMLCRCDDYEEIADFVEARRDWLGELLDLPAGRTPCRKTFERVLGMLEPEALQACFDELTATLAEAHPGRLVAIDGKTLRGSFDHAHR